MRSCVTTLGFLLLPLVNVVSTSVEAQAAPASQVSAPTQTPPSTGEAELQQARAAIVANDTGNAETMVRVVLESNPTSMDAHLVLALVFRAQGRIDSALEELRAVVQLASAARRGPLQAQALALVADTLERVADRRVEARAAWAAVHTFARDTGLGHAEVAQARVEALDAVTELDRVSAEVRQRIEAREALMGVRRGTR